MADENDSPKRFSADDSSGFADQTEPGIDASQPKAEPSDDCPAQLAKVRNEFLYLYAEFENYKKNAIKERSDIRKYGCERLVVDLLNVLDIFETALSVDETPENVSSFRKGIQMTASELKAVLQRNGIEEVPALGTQFNPAHHEALSSEESADLAPGHVSRVFKKPYKLHDKVIRHGQVVVAKAKSN